MSTWIHSLAGHAAWADAVVGAIAVYGVGAVVLVLAAAWFGTEGGLRSCLAAVAGAAAAVVASAAIGVVWDRPRPFVAGHFVPLIAHAPDASFPSDHLAVIGAVAIALWFAARRLALLTVIVALAVAFARVYAGVHYVSDVAGGFALGLICGGVAWWATGLIAVPLQRVDQRLTQVGLRPAAARRRSARGESPQ